MTQIDRQEYKRTGDIGELLPTIVAAAIEYIMPKYKVNSSVSQGNKYRKKHRNLQKLYSRNEYPKQILHPIINKSSIPCGLSVRLLMKYASKRTNKTKRVKEGLTNNVTVVLKRSRTKNHRCMHPETLKTSEIGKNTLDYG